MIRFLLPLVITLAAAGAAYLFNVTRMFGAHPFWAENVILWGVPIGIVLGLISTLVRYHVALIGLGALTIIAYAVAHVGKARFAASYAEDTFGGQMWFFGWNAIVIFAAATIFVGAAKINQPKSPV